MPSKKLKRKAKHAKSVAPPLQTPTAAVGEPPKKKRQKMDVDPEETEKPLQGDPRPRHRQAYLDLLQKQKEMRAARDKLGYTLEEREQKKEMGSAITKLITEHKEKCLEELKTWLETCSPEVKAAYEAEMHAKTAAKKYQKNNKARKVHQFGPKR
eukprot:gb/GEZN01015795.1/.p1 GENE.gb/GEZN01015795.1/~~gb/GEZN01015795.1/.p1  ORF type:complete len:164 (+),score=41.32 gb/GEZN01015795.1/:29-493(+)